LRRLAAPIVANPPFVADVTPLDAPSAPGKTLPAADIIARLRCDTDA